MKPHNEDDPLASLFTKHKPQVPPAPQDEWQRIVQRLPEKSSKRSWYLLSFALSCAMILFLCVPHQKVDDSEWDELWLEEGNSALQNPKSYDDWLQLTDTLEQQTP